MVIGRKVSKPTCSVTLTSSTPACWTREQILRKMQTGRRRGHRARIAGVHGLITLAVGGHHLAPANVVRQRHSAGQLQQFQIAELVILARQSADLRPGDPDAVGLLEDQPQLQGVGAEAADQVDRFAGHDFSPGLGQQPPIALPVGGEEQSLPAALRRSAVADEPGGDHPGFVQHQRVALE